MACITCHKQKSNHCYDCDDLGIKYLECRICREDPRTYICSKCNLSIEHNKMHFERGVITTICNNCIAKRSRQFYESNKNYIKARVQSYSEDNKDKIQQYQTQYRSEHKDETKEYNKNYNILNSEQIKKDRKEYNQLDYVKVRRTLHNRILKAIKAKNAFKNAKTLELVGCSVSTFMKWIEFQFTPEMNWDNHGTYWHIDHCIPCNSFNLQSIIDQKQCFNWSNLQPLPGLENIAKSDKIDQTMITNQKLKAEMFIAQFKELFVENNELLNTTLPQ